MGKNNDFDNQQIQYDEWGDPVKKKTLPESKRLYTDEWGDPVKKISVNEENREYMNELEKVALEKELVDKQLIYPRAHYLPRGRLRGIVAVCLAFFFGIFVVLGGLVGVGVWAGTKAKMRTLLGSNAGNLLRDDYLDMSVLQLITTVANDMKGGIDDLNDISKYTPLVDTLLDKLDSAADKYGITYDREVLKATKFSEFSSYLVDDVLKNIEIGKVATSLGVTDPMVIAIFYGEEGEDFEYDANGNIVPIEGGRAPLVVNDFMTDIMGSLGTVRLGTLMGLNKNASEEKALGDSAMLYALCYGKYSSDYTKDENGKYHVVNGDYTIVEGMVKVDADNLAAKKAQKDSADAANTAKTLADTEGEEGAEDEKFIYPTSIDDLIDSPNAVINDLELGTMLGIGTNVTDEKKKDNALMLTLCYGTEGVDYKIENGTVVMLEGKKATTIKELTENSNELINDLELGTMLGIGTDVSDEDKESNALMLALCYGTEGVDYKIENGNVVMLEGHDTDYPTTVGQLTESSNDIINKMEVETLMSIKIDSDKVMHYLAYGPEMAKGTTPYKDSKDAEGRPVDEHGYLLDENGHYKTEFVKDDEGNDTTEKQYVGGGTYVYTYDSEGNATGVQMLPDPNAEGFDPDSDDNVLYPKRTVGALTEKDAGLLEGMKIGDVMEIDSDSSNIMRAMKNWTLDDLKNQDKINDLHLSDILDIHEKDPQKPGDTGSSGILLAMKDWTLNDLNDQNKIESLTIGEVLDIKGEEQGDTSNIMWALRKKSLKDLQNQNTIESLKLSEIITIDTNTSGILQAMQDWQISDLQNQTRIERLRIGQIINVSSNTTGLMAAIKNWRIGDLSDSDKIESLKLSDVITINSDDHILNALKDTQVGRLQDGIDELTLTELLGDVSKNTILKGLANSTVASLSNDIENLTISTIFGDEIYSYMKIENEKTYQKLYEDYFNNHNTNHGKNYLPEAYAPENLETRLFVKNEGTDTEVLKGYFEKGTDTLYAGKVLRDYNDDGEAYSYYNKKDVLTVIAEKKEVVYVEATETVPAHVDYVSLSEGITDADLKPDGFGGWYYYKEVAGEGENAEKKKVRVEVEEVVTGYKLNGTPLTQDSESGKWKLNEKEVNIITETTTAEGVTTSTSYILTRVELEEKYYEKENATKTYPLSESVEERYYDGEAQLDRYVSGVWFLLLGGIKGEVAPTYDKDKNETTPGTPGTITFNGDPKLTEIADSITEVNTTLNDTTLWKLYFVRILPDDPFVSLGKTGVVFEHTYKEHDQDTGLDQEKTVYRKVTDLSDISISELVPFITAFTDMDFLANYLKDSGFDFTKFLAGQGG